MERLVDRFDLSPKYGVDGFDYFLTYGNEKIGKPPTRGENQIALKKLYEYEQAESEGKIAVLPCKRGYKLFMAWKNKELILEYTVSGIKIGEFGTEILTEEGTVLPPQHIGKDTFFSRKEAEEYLMK